MAADTCVHDPRPVGLVLAGGRGRRMGGGLKALVPFRGEPMLAYAIEALHPHCSRVLLSANQPAPFAPFGLPVVPDLHHGHGPLRGIQAGLQAAGGAPVLVLACDLPLIEAEDIAPLVAAGQPDSVAIYGHARGREPLVGWYGPGVMGGIEGQLLRGDFKVLDLFDVVPTTVLPWTGDLRVFTNVNTQADLAQVEELGERLGRGRFSRA